jgi:alkylhydroperoxidase/carboxymuconolactone decarboxylase family protein YurZ
MPEHPLSTLRKIDPDFMKEVQLTEDLVYKDGALPRKLKLLIAMAFDAADGAAGGVTALARMAIQAGATKEEITEVLRVASHFSGIGTLYIASIALKEIFPD